MRECYLNPPQLAAAYTLDLFLGDPEWFPHPVRFFGLLTNIFERRLPKTLLTGAALTATVVTAAWAMGRPKQPALKILLAWTTLATRSLLNEAQTVIEALEAKDLNRARRRLSRIVGRDTDHLDESAISRALIETLAESACDGIVAPLFWLATAGLPAAMAYKAINTLDSMIGHPEPPYHHFGRIAARLDDAANLIPARLTALGIIAAAKLHNRHAQNAFHIWRRDGNKHASPNAGQSEAAIAGALNVQLGGDSTYNGQPHHAPLLNAEARRASVTDAKAALKLTAIVSSLAFAAALLLVRRK